MLFRSVGELADRLELVTSTTQEETELMGRITTLLNDGTLYQRLGIAALNPEEDRVMICGSMAMLKDVKVLVELAGFTEESNSKPGQFVVERAFVD